MKKMYESFKIAFSMYSKIPMPNSQWTKENMEFAMCFFPFIGVVIGIIFSGFFCMCQWFSASGLVDIKFFTWVGLTLIPVFITGGIHLDGLLDTADALSSYQTKERKLEILKDPTAGAFAVITCCGYFLSILGIYSLLDKNSLLYVSITFVLSRVLSGLAIVTFPLAKGTGLAATFQNAANKKKVKWVFVIYLSVIVIFLLCFNMKMGIIMVLLGSLCFAYYYKMSIKQFGGITGDLAGYFLQIFELVVSLGIVLGGKIL